MATNVPRSDRTIKDATLFIMLNSACLALTEVLLRRRVHPVQYLLLGLALFFSCCCLACSAP